MRCRNKKVLAYVKERFDLFAQNYTTSDITKTVVKLFKKHADMVPLREHGGAYFVPIKLIDFVVKIEKMLRSLCPRNSMTIIEVPNREVSKMQIQESLTNEITKFKDALKREIDTMKEKGKDGFSKTQHGNRVGEISAMSKRVKMYADMLKYEADDQMAIVEEADKLVLGFFTPESDKVAKEEKPAPKKKTSGAAKEKASIKDRLKAKLKSRLKKRLKTHKK